jgi:hypothetical protein
MQFVHGTLELTGYRERHGIHCLLHGTLYQLTILFRGTLQHIVDHLIAVAGMADTDAQAQKVITAHMRNQITQAVMPAMTTAPLQPRDTGRQIKFIMNNQYLVTRNTKEVRQCDNRLAAPVHIGRRFLQAAIVPLEFTATHLALETGLVFQTTMILLRNPVNEPESGIMPALFMFRARISQTDNQSNGGHGK